VIKHLMIFIKKNLILIMNTSLIVILVIGIDKRINLIIYMVKIIFWKIVKQVKLLNILMMIIMHMYIMPTQTYLLFKSKLEL
jgi:hypothetical protein